ncbi:MAG: ABC transporter permease [Bacteroides cellulosilyticus]
MQLVAGEWISDKSNVREVNIMETTARTMGWTPEEAIGKHIFYCNKEVEPMTVIGVIKDCAYRSPSRTCLILCLSIPINHSGCEPRCFVLFKYKPGTWEECRRSIEEMQQAELPDRKLFLDSEEERYNKYLQSENALSSLLGFSAIVCILISIFGIYSLVSLTCEQRRKEIAIRKVNGATISNILSIFFKEYAMLLIVSSLIAFPAGYTIMKHWIETYNRQVSIGHYRSSSFLGIAMVITISISWRVWQAARQNPAEVIKE